MFNLESQSSPPPTSCSDTLTLTLSAARRWRANSWWEERTSWTTPTSSRGCCSRSGRRSLSRYQTWRALRAGGGVSDLNTNPNPSPSDAAGARDPAADGESRRGDSGAEGDVQLAAAGSGHQNQEAEKGQRSSEGLVTFVTEETIGFLIAV